MWHLCSRCWRWSSDRSGRRARRIRRSVPHHAWSPKQQSHLLQQCHYIILSHALFRLQYCALIYPSQNSAKTNRTTWPSAGRNMPCRRHCGYYGHRNHITYCIKYVSAVLRRGPYDYFLRMGSKELRVGRTSTVRRHLTVSDFISSFSSELWDKEKPSGLAKMSRQLVTTLPYLWNLTTAYVYL